MKKGDLEDLAYTELKNAIVTGSCPPGMQIAEDMIANQLNMSRSPVRVAIKRLQAEGFLERRANKRIYVTFANEKRTLDALYVREALEGIAARLAAVSRTEDDIKQLQAIMSEAEELIQQNNIYESYRIGFKMHKKIFCIARNEQLSRFGIITLEQESVISYRSLQNSLDRAKIAHQEHEIIVNHIITGNADEAEAAARQHIVRLQERLLQYKFSDPTPRPLVF